MQWKERRRRRSRAHPGMSVFNNATRCGPIPVDTARQGGPVCDDVMKLRLQGQRGQQQGSRGAPWPSQPPAKLPASPTRRTYGPGIC